jgi:hypothetical protein
MGRLLLHFEPQVCALEHFSYCYSERLGFRRGFSLTKATRASVDRYTPIGETL